MDNRIRMICNHQESVVLVWVLIVLIDVPGDKTSNNGWKPLKWSVLL